MKKTVNWTLYNIGKRNAQLKKGGSDRLATEIQKMDWTVARCVVSTLRES